MSSATAGKEARGSKDQRDRALKSTHGDSGHTPVGALAQLRIFEEQCDLAGGKQL